MIRLATKTDADRIASIYNHYIQNSFITFEEVPLTAVEMASRIEEVNDSGLPWFVAEQDDELAGYAYASKWKGRCAYRYSVEATVYLADGFKSKGWGTKLYEALFEELRRRSIHVVIGGIALPNPASVALHEKLGMEKIAHFKEVGFKFGQWLDVGYWQVKLED